MSRRIQTNSLSSKVTMLIYADFNGVEECASDKDQLCVDLTGYGTLASLSLHGVRVHEGQDLSLVDPDGLTANGQCHFDRKRVSKHCSGWFAKFARKSMTSGPPLAHDYGIHVCFKCRRDIKPYLDKVGRQFAEDCPYCGTSVMLPLSPP